MPVDQVSGVNLQVGAAVRDPFYNEDDSEQNLPIELVHIIQPTVILLTMHLGNMREQTGGYASNKRNNFLLFLKIA